MVVFERCGQGLGWSLDVRDSFEVRSDPDVRIGVVAAGEPVDHNNESSALR
ncbi:MAG: hypothetical protein WAL25_03990 [Acidimicrobiia bacterium]